MSLEVHTMKGFSDPWNPTEEEIVKWAYNREKVPIQDWELAVNSIENIEMIISFVEDVNCPKRRFF